MESFLITRQGACLGLVFALLMAGCAAAGQGAPTPTPIPQVVEAEKAVFTVERGPIRSVRDIYGEIVPSRQENLYFSASGYVTRVTVKEGDMVRQGDLLAELQVDDLLAQLEQATIDLQVAQDSYESHQLEQAYELQKAESDVAIQTIQVDQMKKHLERLWGSQKEDALADLAMAEERLKTSQAYLEMVKGRKDSADQAVVERNRLAVERLNRLVAERQIYAPYDGIVLDRYLKPGNDIEAFSTAFTVGDPQSLVVRIPYDNQLYEKLEPSTPVFMSLTRTKEQFYPVKFLPDFLPVTNHTGGLDTSGDAPQLTYFYFSTPVELQSGQLPLGGGATLEVVLGEKEDALLLSPVAIRGNEAFKYVIVLEGDTHRRVELISIGLKGDQMWEVSANLKEGDQILGP